MATLEHLLSQQTTERLGWTLIHFVWQAAAVALLLAIVLRILRRRSAEARYIASCLALLLVIALPLVTMPSTEVPGPAAEAGPASVLSAPPTAQPVDVVEVAELPPLPLDERPLTIPAPEYRLPLMQQSVTALESAIPYLVLGWLLGVFGLAAWHLGGWAQLQRVKRHLVREVGAPLMTQVATLSERLAVHKTVGLLESALVDVPTVVGWIKPAILLPAAALSGLDPAQLEAILAHELAHIRRHDYLVNLAQTVVEILGFFHPAVWWISHKIRDERENCCDDLAVQVCGDSVRYARALTRLEEMRHRSTELAVAASGGSLAVRIDRLLGHPTADNRRFTWLPGLIALLLVALIVIPTALVLAAPGQGGPESSVEQGDAKALKDSVQFLLETRVVFVFDEKVLARNTVTSVRSILGSYVTESYPDVWRNVTAGDFFASQLGDRALPTKIALTATDALHRGKFVEVIDMQQMVGADGHHSSTALISQSYPFVPPPPEVRALERKLKRIYAGVTLGLTPRTIDGRSTMLQIAVEQAETAAHAESATSAVNTGRVIQSREITLGDECFVFHVAPPREAGLSGSLYVVVNAFVIKADTHSEPIDDVGAAVPLEPPTNYAAANTLSTNERSADGTGRQDEDRVRVDVILAKAIGNAALDRETILQIGNAFAVEYPQVADEIGRGSKKGTTLEEILQRYVAGKPLQEETVESLISLLESRGYASIDAKPSFLTRDNIQAQIMVGSDVPIRPPGSPASAVQHAELGTAVKVTPHLPPSGGDRIRLEIEVKWTERAKEAEAHSSSAIRTTEIASAVTTVPDRYVTLLAESGDGESAPDADSELMLVMLRAVGTGIRSDQDNSPAAQRQETENPPRQVVLNVRTVVMEKDHKAGLGIEWAHPQISAGVPGGDTAPAAPKELQIGYTPDKAVTEALRLRLSELCEQGRAEIVSDTEVFAFDGSEVRVGAVTEEWFYLRKPETTQNGEFTGELMSIDSGMTLTATPRIGDSNEITLAMVVEYTRAIAPERSSELPVVTRRTTRNMVAVKDGGTVALARLAESEKEITVFVTARIVPDNGQLPQTQWGSSSPKQTLPAPRPPERATHIAPGQEAGARRDYLRTDPIMSEMLRRIADLEAELIVARQTLAPRNPELAQKQQLLEAFRRRLAERRQELEREFDMGLAPRSGPIRVSTEPADKGASPKDEQTAVVVDFTLVKVPTDRTLAPEVAARLSSLWNQLHGEGKIERAWRAEEMQISPAQLLKRCTVDDQGNSAALEIMIDLLTSLEYVRVVLKPSVEVHTGKQAEIRSTQEVPDPAARPGTSETVECGTVLKITPHAENADRIALDIMAEITDLIPSDSPGEPPCVSTCSIDTKAVLGKDKTLALRLEPTTEREAQDDNVPYLLVRPRIVRFESTTASTVTATFIATSLIDAIGQIAAQAGAKIGIDATVRPEPVTTTVSGVSVRTALLTILTGTDYTFKHIDNSYLIYRPVNQMFHGIDRRDALAKVASDTGVLIICDPSVSGSIWAGLQDEPLETALDILLGGSPYLVTKTPDYYLIAAPQPEDGV